MEFNDRGKRLARLQTVWIDNPVYLITCCVSGRRRILHSESVHAILQDEWNLAPKRHGWYVGRYVIMPDHVHFFTSQNSEAKSLSKFLQSWKQWTSKRISKERGCGRIWQRQFFDHLLRSEESCSEKWEYVKMNPVRAGLVRDPEDWKYAGFVHYG